MSDTFRKNYHTLLKKHSDTVLLIKSTAEELEKLLSPFKSREMSLALTNLEQSIMWATKAIVLHDQREQLNANQESSAA